jgi:GH43 family beta-xylosidase
MRLKSIVARTLLMVVLAGGMSFSSISFGQEAIANGASGDTSIRGADPSVIQTADGFVAVESRIGRNLFVRTAPSLAELADAKATRVWSDPDQLGEVWAPEIVFRDGRYQIYFAAGVTSDHRMYVVSSDQPAADYGDATEILLPDDKWAIDGIPFHFEGKNYFVWSGWQGDTDVQQDIFVVEINADDRPQSPRAMISSPDQSWENIAGDTPTINEGPQPIVDPAGQLHVFYSANGSWAEHYCIADLRLKAEGDPLNPQDWFKSNGCLFGANPATLGPEGVLATKAKGVGHHSFVLPDGVVGEHAAQDTATFFYHGVPAEETPANFWAARRWFKGIYEWVPDVTYGTGEHSDLGWSIRFAE